MNKKEEHDSFNLVGVAILFPILSILVSYAVSYVQKITNDFKITVMIFGGMCLFIILFVGCCWNVYLAVMKHHIDEEIQASVKKIRQDLNSNKLMDGIYREEQLAIMERTQHFDEIWLISPDFSTEIEEGVYSNVVKDNLKKGTKYKYFVPRTDINKHRVRIFWEACNRNKHLEIYFLTDDFFFLVPDIDFAIYEPNKVDAKVRSGYMGLGIQGESERFAVKMNTFFVDALSAKLEGCMTFNAVEEVMGK